MAGSLHAQDSDSSKAVANAGYSHVGIVKPAKPPTNCSKGMNPSLIAHSFVSGCIRRVSGKTPAIISKRKLKSRKYAAIITDLSPFTRIQTESCLVVV